MNTVLWIAGVVGLASLLFIAAAGQEGDGG